MITKELSANLNKKSVTIGILNLEKNIKSLRIIQGEFEVWGDLEGVGVQGVLAMKDNGINEA